MSAVSHYINGLSVIELQLGATAAFSFHSHVREGFFPSVSTLLPVSFPFLTVVRSEERLLPRVLEFFSHSLRFK
jgi:hypothetical protein